MSKRNGFFKFVVPSVLAFALSGVYTIVDGFFIGNSLGDAGLASITLGYPISAFVQAAGTGIGLSGAIRFTILRGQQKEEDAKRCLGSTVLLFALASMLLKMCIRDRSASPDADGIYRTGKSKRKSEGIYSGGKGPGGSSGSCAFLRPSGTWKDYPCRNYCQ